MTQSDIRDLALIGDRRTAALLDRWGRIVWYCPKRFDEPALLTALLDAEEGGHWSIGPELHPLTRRYLEESGVLETVLATSGGPLILTDLMPLGDGLPRCICRRFSPAPQKVVVSFFAKPDYGRLQPTPQPVGNAIGLGSQVLYASHPLQAGVSFTLPRGERGWAFLADADIDAPHAGDVEYWLEATLSGWRERAARTDYSGPYAREVEASLRASGS